MTPLRGGVLAALALLAGCGGGGRDAPPVDEARALSFDSGAGAMSLARFDQAARDYRDAYRLALRDDDAGAIGTAGTDLAIALVAGGHPADALSAAATTRADLALRSRPPPPELLLAEAAALLRQHRPADASRVVAPAEAAPDPEVAARAAFLRGLAADATGDTATLAASLARLQTRPKAKVPLTWQGDRTELQARLDAASGDPAASLAVARTAIALRREALDDRGLRRVLLLASAQAARLGQRDLATDLRRQAAQSEAATSEAKPDGCCGGASPL